MHHDLCSLHLSSLSLTPPPPAPPPPEESAAIISNLVHDHTDDPRRVARLNMGGPVVSGFQTSEKYI